MGMHRPQGTLILIMRRLSRIGCIESQRVRLHRPVAESHGVWSEDYRKSRTMLAAGFLADTYSMFQVAAILDMRQGASVNPLSSRPGRPHYCTTRPLGIRLPHVNHRTAIAPERSESCAVSRSEESEDSNRRYSICIFRFCPPGPRTTSTSSNSRHTNGATSRTLSSGPETGLTTV